MRRAFGPDGPGGAGGRGPAVAAAAATAAAATAAWPSAALPVLPAFPTFPALPALPGACGGPVVGPPPPPPPVPPPPPPPPPARAPLSALRVAPGPTAASSAAGQLRAGGVAWPFDFPWGSALGAFRFRFPAPPSAPGWNPGCGPRAPAATATITATAAAATATMSPAAALREATRLLCAAGGALELDELRGRLAGTVGAEPLERLLRDGARLVVARRAGAGAGAGAAAAERVVVLAASELRLCRAPPPGAKVGCQGFCSQLHLCKFMVYGACKFLRAGKPCRNSHSLTTPHNVGVLQTHGVDHLNFTELCQLLYQNDPWLLPEICLHYNKGDGPYGSCTFQTHCIKLHMCQYFLRGQCKFGSSCKRSHDFSSPENLEKLLKMGLSSDLVSKLPDIYRNAYDIKNKNSSSLSKSLVLPAQGTSEKRDRTASASSSATSASSSVSSQGDSDQICLFHIRKSCSFQDKCNKVHFHLPYRWQFLDGSTWKDLDKMELIEEAYSHPQRDRVTCAGSANNFPLNILNFHTMMFGSFRARRLSTVSSATRPPHFIFTTEWVWYWTDELGAWQEYGKQGTKHPVATVSSSDLEKAYQEFCMPGSDAQTATFKFQAGSHKYELDFKAFVQKNLVYSTVRKVCRRPKYVSPKDVKGKQTCHVNFQGPKNIPDHWDPSALPDPGFKKILLNSSSEEYQQIWKLFNQTLPCCSVQKIERVQNLALWEVYQWQKAQMQKRNGDEKVDERQLFHGTSSTYVDAICQQNFDWRICGLHGTSYGKGSYFARDAAYSHHYCKSDLHSKTMFVARVLVGEFIRGNPTFVRPPAREGQSNLFYDSCVNSVTDPSIFVIFEKHQAYPEYVIHYTAPPDRDAGVFQGVQSSIFYLSSVFGGRR